MRWMVLVVTIGLGLTGLAVGPALAHGVEDLRFSVSGQLPKFPCPEGCEATFSGTGAGRGNLGTRIDGDPSVATFAFDEDTLSGVVDYSEPGFPFCPLVGSAGSPTTGSVELTGRVTGIILRNNARLPLGRVTSVSITLDFSYQRVGATPLIEITGGSMTVGYWFPAPLYEFPKVGLNSHGSFTEVIEAGAGGGVFRVDPVQAVSNCQSPGELDFEIEGLAGIVTQSTS